MRMSVVTLVLLLASLASAQTRVFVQGSHGFKYVAGVDHGIPAGDGFGHDQTMELAKTMLARCPDVVPTVNREHADFVVYLNWTERTRFFGGGKIFHKPDQIIVETRDGDVLYSGIARSVGGNVEGVCRTVTSAIKSATSYNPSVPPNSTGTIIPELGILANTRREGGVQVMAVAQGGRAEQANMHVGDVINTFNGVPINTVADLASASSSAKGNVAVRYVYHTGLGYIPRDVTIALQ